MGSAEERDRGKTVKQTAASGPRIHPTALVDPSARLGPEVTVGAYTVIGPKVEVGAGTWIGHHVVIAGNTRIGARNRIFHFCSLGEIPQDKKYGGEETRLEIGNDNTIREFCTFNIGTAQDAGVTRLGDNNWIMAYVHLAHDCQVGNHTVFANNAQLAGHVRVGDYAILGGFTVVHQFVHIGAHALTGMGTVLLQDVPPYVTASGNPARPYGINSEGLRRRGFSSESIMVIKRAYRTLYKAGQTLEQARAELAQKAATHPELQVLVDFLSQASRGIVR
ncbi:acyl-ACP--UDP-N-acetylglucosamine O-acyltransferase [Pelomicrobium methylotrophicum]|uniref:Acyl-[acyl-carrier-protein]--UDP-N-acetylglucosamine O-acyltransferase n=1 Tax=Pelomicrobium methylotrophicum TaxID=2602750 RepID=A0A5C7EQ04_9PROT|nr:acyl-ACP--UDP-N-acetylglucosamine O-acyltransferase [Pelomicrobium methylotrophicum]TXF13662.1 acyl-ACP--UDP-N-acetylglucosamine O-acyltransferase [Pelomicrobium methylotrophicum]